LTDSWYVRNFFHDRVHELEPAKALLAHEHGDLDRVDLAANVPLRTSAGGADEQRRRRCGSEVIKKEYFLCARSEGRGDRLQEGAGLAERSVEESAVARRALLGIQQYEEGGSPSSAGIRERGVSLLMNHVPNGSALGADPHAG
jgi:hypothetical protein